MLPLVRHANENGFETKVHFMRAGTKPSGSASVLPATVLVARAVSLLIWTKLLVPRVTEGVGSRTWSAFAAYPVEAPVSVVDDGTSMRLLCSSYIYICVSLCSSFAILLSCSFCVPSVVRSRFMPSFERIFISLDF